MSVSLRDSPRVSFLIPTWNRAQWLERAVSQAANALGEAGQGQIEIVVVDDASPDNTPEVMAALKEKYPNLVYLRQSENGGLAQARNAGLEIARAEFVALLDDDDGRLPGTLEAQLQLLEANPDAAVCYGKVHLCPDINLKPSDELHPPDGAPMPQGDVFWDLLRDNFVAVPSAVFRREMARSVGNFDARLRCCEDWDLWIRLAHDHPFVAVSDVVALYRLPADGSGQLSSQIAVMACQGTSLQKEWRELSRSQDESRKFRASNDAFLDRTCRSLTASAARAMGRLEFRQARHDLLTILRVKPRHLFKARSLRWLARSFFPPRRPAP